MNRRFLMISFQHEKTSVVGLILCGSLFLCGSIIGTLAAGFVNDGSKLNTYISSYLSFFSNGTTGSTDFLSTVIDTYKYHLIALFLGFSVAGVFLIPLLAAVRGFFLSFSVSAIVRLLGGKGILLTLSMFGFNTLIALPCFFVLSVTSFSISLYIFRLVFMKNTQNVPSPFNIKTFFICGICLLALLLVALIDIYLTPHLISFAALRISN